MRYNKNMIREPGRPDPDKLLEQYTREHEKPKRGKLKIFLGYVAGVGKTYAMLEAAHQRLGESVDVVVGYVETHGRVETEALLQGLEVIPRKSIEYHGTQQSEMDLDAVIARNPALVLVDELAHTNVPGSRHPKRYQDVEEILAAGIDVYSTVNIQHLESLSDVVLQITGVSVREKIPDLLIDEADEIELIDLPTDELLKRLKDGKVYISDQAMRALEKFFRKGNLTALRELSLRRAADRVDSQMLSYMQKKDIPGPWPTKERILVCISSHPMGERLIRSGKRLAEDLNAEWFVLFVETPQHLHMPAENRLRVQKFLRMAEELGAKVSSVANESVATAVIEFSRRHNVTKIIAGKPFRPRWFELIRGSVIDQIIRESGSIDVYIVSDDSTIAKRNSPFPLHIHSPIWRYGASLILIALVTLAGFPLQKFLDPTNLVMVYLLVVVLSAIYLGRGPAILTSFVSVLVFDFFFVNPTLSFTVSDTQYLLTFAGLLVVGLIISSSAALLRDQVDLLNRRSNQTQTLFDLSRGLTSATSLDQVLSTAFGAVSLTMNRDCTILLPENGKLTPCITSQDLILDESDIAVGEWAYKNQRPAGHGTDTLSAATMHFIPLLAANNPVGVIGVKQQPKEPAFTIDQKMLLEGLSNLTALAIERALLVDSAAQSEMLRNTEKLQSALLNSISHELRTPLSSITGVLTSLTESEKQRGPAHKLDASTKMELLTSATDQARQLNHLVENLLNMTRIESGAVRLNITPCDLADVISSVVQQFSQRLAKQNLTMEIPEDLPLVNCDAILIAQVVSNLMDNACKYSPEGTPIHIKVTHNGKTAQVSICDSGNGVPINEQEKIFAKFYRGTNHKNASGTGLGLSICKGIIEAHHGWIKAENSPTGGLCIQFSLPLEEGK
jgi:two-component system, OmpR family, sensor histidine kinase KdpD